jgi:hypothetical protein
VTDEKKPSRAELGESAFKGLGGRVPRALVHGGHGERHLALDDRYRKNQPMASSLLVDDEYLYWSTTATLVDYSLEGAIYRRPRRGGAVTVVTVVFDLDGVLLAQDATHIYWLVCSRVSSETSTVSTGAGVFLRWTIGGCELRPAVWVSSRTRFAGPRDAPIVAARCDHASRRAGKGHLVVSARSQREAQGRLVPSLGAIGPDTRRRRLTS